MCRTWDKQNMKQKRVTVDSENRDYHGQLYYVVLIIVTFDYVIVRRQRHTPLCSVCGSLLTYWSVWWSLLSGGIYYNRVQLYHGTGSAKLTSQITVRHD